MSREAVWELVEARILSFRGEIECVESGEGFQGNDPAHGPILYTAGYQDRSVDQFLDELLRHGLRRLVDVRANSVSRKFGFAGRTLARIAEQAGLEYHHFPALGIPSAARSALDGFASYRRLLDAYERDVLPRRRAEVRSVASLAEEAPAVLICFEHDVRCCHRSRLADALARMRGFQVVHLNGGPSTLQAHGPSAGLNRASGNDRHGLNGRSSVHLL
jgi:hypothetical protein